MASTSFPALPPEAPHQERAELHNLTAVSMYYSLRFPRLLCLNSYSAHLAGIGHPFSLHRDTELEQPSENLGNL